MNTISKPEFARLGLRSPAVAQGYGGQAVRVVLVLYNRLWWDSETLTHRSKNLREIPASVCLLVERLAIFFRGLWEPPSTRIVAPSKQWARRSQKDAH
jgi:hypothetical protein